MGRYALTLLVVALSACSERAQDFTDQSTTPVYVPSTADAVPGMQVKVSDLERRLFALESFRDLSKIAWLDPAKKGTYHRIETNLAPVLVSLEGSEKSADGVKLDIDIGNISTGNFLGASGTIRYGARLKDDEDWEQWRASLKTTDFTTPATLQAGTWNSVAVFLPGTEIDTLGHVEIEVTINSVSLRNPSG